MTNGNAFSQHDQLGQNKSGIVFQVITNNTITRWENGRDSAWGNEERLAMKGEEGVTTARSIYMMRGYTSRANFSQISQYQRIWPEAKIPLLHHVNLLLPKSPILN